MHNPDSLWNSEYHGISTWEISLGRWALGIVSMIRGGAVVTVFISFLSFILMGISAVVIVELLHIKKPLYIVIVSAILATTPTFANTLSYPYCSDAYTLAMLLSCLSVYCIYNKNKKRYFIVGSLCVAISMGLYQAYIGITIGLCIIIPILNLLQNKKETKEIWKNIFKSVVMVVVGLIIYYIIAEIFLKIYNVEIASYGGANQISILANLKNLPQAIIQTYKSFITFFFRDGIIFNSYWKRRYINLIFYITAIIAGILIIKKNKIYKNKIKLVMLVVFVLILPIGINSIELIAQSEKIKLLTSVSIYLPYIMLFAMLEMLDTNALKDIIIKWIGVIICFVLIFTYIISDQCTYMVRQYVYNSAYAEVSRIVDRIKDNENYEECMKICFAGEVVIDPCKSQVYNMSTGYISIWGEFWPHYSTSMSTLRKFMSLYLNIDVNWCSDEEYVNIINSDEFSDMGVFPANNSVQVINDIMVVKLADDPEMP